MIWHWDYNSWATTSFIFHLTSSLFKCGSMNNPSRVPRYKKPQEVVGFCDFLVKPLPWRGKGVGGKG